MNNFKKYFTQTIWNRGKRYYQEDRVEIIEDDGYYVNAWVCGNYDDYRVKLEMDEDLNNFYCDCPASNEGEKICKHIAATCMQVVYERKLELNDVEKDIDYIFNRYSAISYNIAYFDIALQEVTNYLKKIREEDFTKYIYELIQTVVRMYLLEKKDERKKEAFLNNIYIEIRNICHNNDAYQSIIYESLSIFEEHSIPIEWTMEYIYNVWEKDYPLDNLLSIIPDQPRKMEYFTACIFLFKKKTMSILDIYEKIKENQNLHVVKEVQLLVYIENKQHQEAKSLYQTLRKKEVEFSIMSDKMMETLDFQLLDKEDFIVKVEQQLQSWHRNKDVEYVKRLRSMYTKEEWEEEKGILFYKWLKKFRDIHRLLILLYNLEEFYLLLQVAYEHKYIRILLEDMFEELQNFDETLFASILMMWVQDLAKVANKRTDYINLARLIDEFKRFNCSKQIIDEILYYLRMHYGNNRALMEIISEYDGGELYEFS